MIKVNIVLPSKEVYEKFKMFFGIDLANYQDTLLMVVTRQFSFDIFAFDTYCKKFLGYREEKDGSLKDFITKKYGEDACKLIMDLLSFPKGGMK